MMNKVSNNQVVLLKLRITTVAYIERKINTTNSSVKWISQICLVCYRCADSRMQITHYYHNNVMFWFD